MSQIALAPGLPSLSVILLMAALVSELFLADLDLGPFSLRVYLLAGLIGALLVRAVRSGESVLRTRQAASLLLAGLAFALWATASRLYNEESLAVVLYGAGSTHALALMAFVLTQALLRRRREAVLLAVVMTLGALLSGAVAVLQWFGVDWAWDLALLLRPGEQLRLTVLGNRIAAYGFVPGLTLSSLQLSYYLLSFGLFTLAWLVCQPLQGVSVLKRLVVLLSLCLLGTAILLTQSRGALLASVLVVALALGYSLRLQVKLPIRALVWRGVLPVCLLLAVVSSVYLLSGSAVDPRPSAGGGRYPLSRIFRFADPVRLELATAGLEFGWRHPWTGGGHAKYTAFLKERSGPSARAISPHNAFLNALVFYGVPGVLLLLLLLTIVVRSAWRALVLTSADPARNWIALGASLGLVGCLVTGQFQSDSFVSGSSLPWWLLGLLGALIAQAQFTEPSLPASRLKTQPAESAGGLAQHLVVQR